MRDAVAGAVSGLVVGGIVVAILALRAKAKYEAQGAALIASLQTRGQTFHNALDARGAALRPEIQAVAAATAKSMAVARATQIMRIYGLDAQTLAKLERYRDTIT